MLFFRAFVVEFNPSVQQNSLKIYTSSTKNAVPTNKKAALGTEWLAFDPKSQTNLYACFLGCAKIRFVSHTLFSWVWRNSVRFPYRLLVQLAFRSLESLKRLEVDRCQSQHSVAAVFDERISSHPCLCVPALFSVAVLGSVAGPFPLNYQS
jgi:hypothetical protein